LGGQFARALDGFTRNAFFVIIDDKQAESLDQEFVVAPTTKLRPNRQEDSCSLH
jgi:hypothetical protein